MEFVITFDEQKLLLSQAREVITAVLEKRKPVFNSIKDETKGKFNAFPTLDKECGVFVSLHMRPEHRLRGCIGRIHANLPLIETVRLMAREAAFGDPRFPPLETEELPQLQIEISALSPMSLCYDPREIKIGVHGIYLVKGGRSGVFLPQVPVEQGWNLDEYLDYICVKAGLPSGSYEAPSAQLYTFTAIVFSEER